MRLSMMPTARKKMSGIGMFMSRHTDGTASGPTSPRQGTATVAPAQSPPQTTLQPAPQIIVSRQDIAAAAKIPVPRGGRFGFTGTIQTQSQQQQHQQVVHRQPASLPPTSSPPAPPHYHPMQRSKTSDQGRETGHAQHPNGGMWEDSTVASMFEETDSRAGSERYRGHHNRAYSETAYQRPVAQFERQRVNANRDEHPPFVIGGDGMLTVVTKSGAAVNGPSATTLNTSVQSNINEEGIHQEEDPYQDDHQYENTPPRNNTLRRTKLAHRDAPREPTQRTSFTDNRPAAISSPPESSSIHGSPGRRTERNDRIDPKVEEAVRERELREYERARERERERERAELHHKRSTVFENLTPIDDPTWLTQQAVGAPTADATTSEDFKESLQRTPRAASISRQVSRPTSRQPLAAQNALLKETSLTRTSSRRLGKSSKKRQRSPDYNDAELNAMNYAELAKQDFDFDPQQAAMQQTTIPSGNSLQDKLAYYKEKDSLEQDHFFTRISVNEWEEAGDWFLEQFGGIVQKMKMARKAKRETVAKFEQEITEREEAVRNKMEGISRTLQELKQEGQNMMSGKEVV